jgi:hypothetical protein
MVCTVPTHFSRSDPIRSGLELERVADDHGTPGSPQGADRVLRRRLSGLVDEQPAQ